MVRKWGVAQAREPTGHHRHRPDHATGDSPTGVHRRVPALGGRQGTDRRPRAVPPAARHRRVHLALDGVRASRSTRQAGWESLVDQGRRPPDHRHQRPPVLALRLLGRGPGGTRPAGTSARPGLPARRRSAWPTRPWSSGRATTWRSGHPTGGTTTGGRSTTHKRWPRPSRGSGSSATTCASRIRSGSDRSGWRRDEGRARSGAGGGGHRDARSQLPAAFRSMPPWAAVGTPSGSWRRPTLMAASSASMPMGRPSPEWPIASGPASATASSFARRTSASSATVAPEAGFGAVDGCLFDLGLSSYQLADTDRGFGFRAGGPLDMRFDTIARRPRGRAPRDPRRRRADRPLPALRRGAEGAAHRPGHRRCPADRPGRDRRGAGRARRARRAAEPAPAAPDPPGDARLPGAAHRGQRGARCARRPVSAAAVDLLRPGGRLVVLSYHSLEDRIVKRFIAAERRGCVCPPELPVCVCGQEPPPAPRHPALADALGGRDRRQPTRPERPSAGRRAPRRLGSRSTDDG